MHRYGKTYFTPLPYTQRRLVAIGENLRLARLPSQTHYRTISERAGIDRTTLYGSNGRCLVSFGAYVNVLLCLGLDHDLDAIGERELGRKLQMPFSLKHALPKTRKERFE